LSIHSDSLARGQTSEVRAAFSADLASTGCGPTEESHFLLGHLYDLQAFPERSAGSRYSADGSSKGGNSTAQVPRGGEAAALVRPESHILDFGPFTPNTLGSSSHTAHVNPGQEPHGCHLSRWIMCCPTMNHDVLPGNVTGGDHQVDVSTLFAPQINFILKNYSESLRYGHRRIYQSLPRLLTLWFENGARLQSSEQHKVAQSFRIAAMCKISICSICCWL
jgi:hypothetical protein